MSKQVYIDSNGNEVLVSGTVNSADMMPMSASDSTKVSEAIGDLSSLTTSDKSSLVGAVNEVNSDKADVSDLTPKQYDTPSAISISGNATITQTYTITDAKYKIITGFAITGSTNVVAVQFFFTSATTVQVRVRNVSSDAGTFNISFLYI